MKKWILRVVYALLVLAPVAAIADYSATQGSGSTVFAFVCFTTKICPAQVLMNSSGTEIGNATTPVQISLANTGANATPVKVDGSAVTQPVSGTVTANLGTTAGIATAANQATNGATTAHTCSTAGFSELGCLGQIDDDVKGPIAAGTNVIGFTSNDPCNQATKKTVPVSQAASGIVITHTTGQKTYVCGGVLVAGAAEIVGFEEGTGTVCATGTTVLAGSSTTANGMSLAANGGFKVDPIFATAAASDDVCLIQNGTSRVSGWLTYVQQ